MCKSVFSGVLVLLVTAAMALQGKDDYSLSEEAALYGKVAPVEISTREGKVSMADLYGRSPLILAFVYTRCAGVCSPFLSRLTENIGRLDIKEEYRIAVVSLDPADRLQDMLRFADHFSVAHDDRWVFGVTSQVDTLIRSIGLKVARDSITNQYDHDALLAGINREGYIVKKLIGIRNQNDMALMIREINGAYIPSYPLPGSATLFSCFTYDPATQKNKPALGLLLLISPALLTLSIITAIALRYRHRHTQEP